MVKYAYFLIRGIMISVLSQVFFFFLNLYSIIYLQVLNFGPPAAMQVVYVLLLAHLLERTPVGVWHSEPLRVPRPDVDVDGGKVVILLVAGGSRSWYLNHGWDFMAKNIMVHYSAKICGIF